MNPTAPLRSLPHSASVRIWALAAYVLAFAPVAARAVQFDRPLSNEPERAATVQAPIVLCLDDKPTRGGQPSGAAYAKAAANGYRSVLTLRAKEDGVDVMREKWLVERNKMRYFNLPATSRLPRFEQVDEFLALARDPANHPMLINCASAERVAPYMIIFRIQEQRWPEDRAIEEAKASGLDSGQLKKFVRAYLARLEKKKI